MDHQYEISMVREESRWICIYYEGWEYDANGFVSLVKKIQEDCSGTIIKEGLDRYVIIGSELALVYQYDTLFGMVVEYPVGCEKEKAIEFIERFIRPGVERHMKKFEGDVDDNDSCPNCVTSEIQQMPSTGRFKNKCGKLLSLLEMFKKKKKTTTAEFGSKETIELFVLEYKEKHFELYPRKGIIKYKNVISPTRACEPFSEGYFDEKKHIMTGVECYKCNILISKLIQNTTLTSHLDFLPPGASRDEYIRIEYSSGSTLFYSNTFLAPSGFMVKTRRSNSHFIHIYKFLSRFCSFCK